jgi:hypothetical protein
VPLLYEQLMNTPPQIKLPIHQILLSLLDPPRFHYALAAAFFLTILLLIISVGDYFAQ